MRLLSSAEARDLDSRASAIGVDGSALMEVAGAKTALVARRMLERAGRRRPAAQVVVLAGRGNNGGDGLVAARYLRNAGHKVRVYLCGGETLKAEAARNLQAWQGVGGRWFAASGEDFWQRLEDEFHGSPDLIVDGLLGIGQTEAPRGDIGRAAGLLASLGPRRRAGDAGREGRQGRGPVVLSLDIPTGVCAETGRAYQPAIWADGTVTFGHPKVGLFLYPGAQLAGEVFCADIGLPPDPGFSGPAGPPGPAVWLCNAAAAAPLLGPRPPTCHKGEAGVVAVFAGSVGMTGAAALVATGAVRAGAGLVTVGTPGPAQPVLAARLTEVMTLPLPAEGGALSAEAVDGALELAAGAGVVALGPGLRRTAGAAEFAHAVVRTCPRPLVVDADGLNAFADRPELIRERSGGSAVIITPHPGELSRLMGVETAAVQSDRLGWARRAAEAAGAVCVLKGAATIVAAPGGHCFVISAGNPGMASGGMGDVLTGVIAAVWAQNLPRAETAAGPPGATSSDALSWRAAAAGALLHSVAGDVAAVDIGSVGISAGDVAGRIPRAREHLLRPERAPRRLRRSLLGVAGIV